VSADDTETPRPDPVAAAAEPATEVRPPAEAASPAPPVPPAAAAASVPPVPPAAAAPAVPPVPPAAAAASVPPVPPPSPAPGASSTGDAPVTASGLPNPHGLPEIAVERPEVAVGAAFVGGLVLAMILKRLAR
jgi:hypothetical protein